MMINYFMDNEQEPSQQAISNALKNSAPTLQQLDAYLDEKIEKISREWKYYNKKSGWVRKTYRGKRNLFFLIIQEGFFSVTFVFGDRAVNAIKKSDLPQEIIQKIVDARQYAEGRGISLDIRSMNELQTIYKLLDIKLQN